MKTQEDNTPSHLKKKPKSNNSKGGLLLAGLVASAIGLGIWGFTGNTSTANDDLTDNQITQRQQQFDTFIAKGIELTPVKKVELFKAYTAMNLQANQIKALEADIKIGKTKLAWITVWDDMSVDGDIINIQAGGFSSQISLTHEKQKMAVPINSNGVTITGVADGGGGITLGFLTSSGAMNLPVIATGQTISIPTK